MATFNHLVIEEESGLLLVHLRDGALIDPRIVREFAVELKCVLAARAAKVIVDFSAVKRCSTEVINTLLQAKKELLAEGGDLSICGLAEGIRYTFRVLNLEGTVFQVFDDVEEARMQF